MYKINIYIIKLIVILENERKQEAEQKLREMQVI